MGFTDFLEDNKATIFYGAIAGFIYALLFNRLDPTLASLLTNLGNEKFYIMIFIGILLAFIVRGILTKELFNIGIIRERFKENQLLIIGLVILGLYLMGNAGLFASLTKTVTKTLGLNPGTLSGVFALKGLGFVIITIISIIAGAKWWVPLIAGIVLLVIFGVPIIGLLIFIFKNKTLIYIGLIVLGLFYLTRFFGGKGR